MQIQSRTYGEGYGRNSLSATDELDGPGAVMATWGMHVEDAPVYTEEDWKKILAMWNQETVRGADTLYWDDVEIGYMPPVFSSRPLTVVDSVYMSGSMVTMMAPKAKEMIRQNYDNTDLIYTSADGVKHMRRVEQSIDTMGKYPRLFVMMAYGRRVMLDMITSFIGDEGWLRRLIWRNGPKANHIIQQVPGQENSICDIFHSKIAVNLTVICPFVLISAVLLGIKMEVTLIQSIFLCIIPAVYACYISVLGMYMNVKFPKYDWTSEYYAVKGGAISVLATLGIGMFSSVVPLFVCIALQRYSNLIMIVTAIFLLVLSVVLYGKLRRYQLYEI